MHFSLFTFFSDFVIFKSSSGCFSFSMIFSFHSGHVAFFKDAARYGDLYVGIGSDATILGLKARQTVCSEAERLYMVKAIRHVKDACINEGSGMMDFVKSVERIKPDIFVVNEDGDSDVKRTFCEERGDRKSTRLNSSHHLTSRMPSSA